MKFGFFGSNNRYSSTRCTRAPIIGTVVLVVRGHQDLYESIHFIADDVKCEGAHTVVCVVHTWGGIRTKKSCLGLPRLCFFAVFLDDFLFGRLPNRFRLVSVQRGVESLRTSIRENTWLDTLEYFLYGTASLVEKHNFEGITPHQSEIGRL